MFMKKVMLTMFASIMLVFVGIISVACCGDNDPTKVESFVVNGLTTSYVNTDTVNLSEISLEVTYDNNQKETLTKYEIDPSEGIELKEDTQFILYTDGLSSQQAGNININDYAITAKVVGFDDILRLGTVSVTLALATEITEYEVSGMETEYFNTNTVDFTGTQLSVTYNNLQTVLLSKFEIDKDISEVAEDTQFVIYTDGLSTQPAGNLGIKDYNITAKVVGFDETLPLGTISVKLATAEDITEHKVSGLKTTYVNTDTVTFEGISLKVTYGNHESEVLTKYEVDKDINEVTDGTQFVIYTSGLSTQPAGNIEDKSYNITAKVVGFENQELNLGTVVVTIAEPTEIVSHEVVYMPTSFYETDTVDFVGTKLRVTFDNHQTIVLTNFELDKDLSEIQEGTEFVIYTDGLSSQSAGDLEIKDYNITAKVVGFNETLALGTVKVESDWNRYEVDTFLVPESIDTYNEIVKNNVSTEEAGFYNVEAMYTIGDDNGFKFKPQLILLPKGSSDITEDYEPETYNVNVKVFMDDNDTALADDSTYYTFDNFEFDFTETAIGHTFKIEMSLTNYPTTLPISFTFKVADGWNVYTADDLARINLLDEGFDPNASGNSYARAMSQEIFYNSNENRYEARSYATIWENYLTEKGYTDLTAVNGIFLHGNLSITPEDLPEEYFVSQVEANKNTPGDSYSVGSLRDFAFLYMHYLNDDFVINGNYFTLDFSTIPFALSNTSNPGYLYNNGQSKYYAGHATVFGFSGLLNNTTESIATFKNLNTVGNTNGITAVDPDTGVTQKDTMEASGALILIKSMHGRTNVDNCISKNFLIAWFAESLISNVQPGVGNMYINQVKTYDCFNSGVFAYASDCNVITNSEFKRFGGPVILMVSEDENTEAGKSKEPRAAGVSVDENTFMENYVAGDEAWFVVQGATTISSDLAPLNTLLGAYGNSFYNSDSKMNLVALAMDSEYLGSQTKNLFVDFSYGVTDTNNKNGFSTTNPYVSGGVSKGTVVFQSDLGDLGYYVPADDEEPSSRPHIQFVSDPNKTNHFDGEYLFMMTPMVNTYAGVIFQLNDLAAQA